MEDMDDDFGYLYADVEAQASSVINGGRDFTRFYTEDDDSDTDSNKTNANPISENANGSSDSEDDLNIVLNDEDCEGKSFPVVEQLDAKNGDDEDGFAAIKDDEVKVFCFWIKMFLCFFLIVELGVKIVIGKSLICLIL